jgi:hypothetical protein
MEITLTDFVEFAIKTGAPKLNHVKAIKTRGPYEPAHDYYKGLRDAIAEFHRTGKGDLKILRAAVEHHEGTHKGSNYESRFTMYKRFLGRKNVEWFEPPRAEWTFDGLTVKVNPELGLTWDGVHHVIKIYWKSNKLSQRLVELVLFLMHQELDGEVAEPRRMALLDLPACNLLCSAEPKANLLPLLRAEARAFVEIWNGI